MMNRVITYSLLAHIHNTGTLVGGLIDIFIPLVKRAISLMNRDGIHEDKSILTIKDYVDRLYDMDIPVPVLRNVLTKVAEEVNTLEAPKFLLYHDSSFSIKNYVFLEFDETVEQQKKEIEDIEKAFKEFCEINAVSKNDYSSIFQFIEKNKGSLSRYLAKKKSSHQQDFSIEAQFVEYFRTIPHIYNHIRKIYLGSIISSYFEYKTENLKTDVELLFDTNFIVSLIDLNTPESTLTCKKLIELGKSQGFKLSVLKDTIEESQRLLLKKAEFLDSAFLQRKINPEDIYNACERRKLTRTDIERISDNLEQTLNLEGLQVVFDTTKFQNAAKFSREYEHLKKIRNTNSAALHDATAIQYVREKRKKKIVEFENVNCWFVNNTITDSQAISLGDDKSRDFQPEIIKVDDLLNILWLSNPNINKAVGERELADIGITALISVTLSETLPKASIIKELDDNIRKYADERLTDKDVVRVATRITKRQLKDIEELNDLAKKNTEEFIGKLLKESEKQKNQEEERIKRLDGLFKRLEEQHKKLERAKDTYDAKSGSFDSVVELKDIQISELHGKLDKQKEERLKEINERREWDRKVFIKKSVVRWRRKSWIEFWIAIFFFMALLVCMLAYSDWQFQKLFDNIVSTKSPAILLLVGTVVNAIFFGIVVKSLLEKYRNHSNIKAFKESIEIPTAMAQVKELDNKGL